MRRFLQRMGIVPRGIVKRLPADMNVVIVAFAFPWARSSIRRRRQRLGFVDDRVWWEVYIALHILEVIGFGNDGAINGGFSVHGSELEVVESRWQVEVSSCYVVASWKLELM